MAHWQARLSPSIPASLQSRDHDPPVERSGGSLREIADALGLSYQRIHEIVDVSVSKGAVKPFARATTQHCTFCGRSAPEVRELIAGPLVFICDDCVELAQQVLDTNEHRLAITRLSPVGPESAKARCSFCGNKAIQVSGMAEAAGRTVKTKMSRQPVPPRICEACLDLCHKILAEGSPTLKQQKKPCAHPNWSADTQLMFGPSISGSVSPRD